MEVGLTICEILPASIAEVFDRLDDGKINFDKTYRKFKSKYVRI